MGFVTVLYCKQRIAQTHVPTTMSQARVSPSMNSCSGTFSSMEGIMVVVESSKFSFLSLAMSLRETGSRGIIDVAMSSQRCQFEET